MIKETTKKINYITIEVLRHYKAQKLKNVEIAKLFDITESSISRILKGKQKLSISKHHKKTQKYQEERKIRRKLDKQNWQRGNGKIWRKFYNKTEKVRKIQRKASKKYYWKKRCLNEKTRAEFKNFVAIIFQNFTNKTEKNIELYAKLQQFLTLTKTKKCIL